MSKGLVSEFVVLGLTKEEVDRGILEYLKTGSPRAVEKLLGRSNGFGNRFVSNDTILARIKYFKTTGYVQQEEAVASFAEVEKKLSSVLRGKGHEEEVAKIEDAIDNVDAVFDKASLRLKVADLKLKQEKSQLTAAEIMARVHGAFDPKNTGVDDKVSLAKQIVAGLKKAGLKPRDVMSSVPRAVEGREIIDVG